MVILQVTARVVLHGSRAAAVRGMPQCMVNGHFVQNLFCKTELCAELWKEEKTKEWHIRATSKQARLVSQIPFCILFYHIDFFAFHLL